MLCLALTLQMSTRSGLKFDLVAELDSDFMVVLRTHALREARRDGSRCDQETQTEATMVFVQIFLGSPKSDTRLLAEGS